MKFLELDSRPGRAAISLVCLLLAGLGFTASVPAKKSAGDRSEVKLVIPAERAVPLYDAIETVHRFGEVIEIKTPESEGTLAA